MKSLKSYRACAPRFGLEVLVVIVQAVRYMRLYAAYFVRVGPEIFGSVGSAHYDSEILQGCVWVWV